MFNLCLSRHFLPQQIASTEGTNPVWNVFFSISSHWKQVPFQAREPIMMPLIPCWITYKKGQRLQWRFWFQVNAYMNLFGKTWTFHGGKEKKKMAFHPRGLTNACMFFGPKTTNNYTGVIFLFSDFYKMTFPQLKKILHKDKKQYI